MLNGFWMVKNIYLWDAFKKVLFEQISQVTRPTNLHSIAYKLFVTVVKRMPLVVNSIIKSLIRFYRQLISVWQLVRIGIGRVAIRDRLYHEWKYD